MTDSKTIKQLADELGVSKTAVRNYMTDEFRANHTGKNSKGAIVIDCDGCKLIAESIAKQPETNREPIAETELITIPLSVWQLMEEQLRQKDQQIADLTEALKLQAQASVAGSAKKLLDSGEKIPWWRRRKGE